VERYATAGEVAAALQPISANIERPRPAKSRRLIAVTALLIVTVTGVAIFILARDDGELRIVQQRLLSDAEAGQRFPAYSPDGSRIAFTAPDPAGVEQVWVRNTGSGDSIQLTRERVPATRPRWLSGDRLLYGIAAQGLWVVSALGGTPTRLIEHGAHADVSRDGRRIVFETRAGIRGALWTAAADGSGIRQISGTAPTYYSLPMGPALSPDGSQVAYFHAEAGPNGDFWVIPLAGGTPRRLTSDLREGGWPVWTPDGNAVVFSSARAGSRTLWQVPAQGGSPVPLTTGAGEDDQPEISVDGRQLAYTNVRHAWELKTRQLSTGQERTLLRRSLETIAPIFSPDGRRITYFGRADEAVAIFTIGADGTDPRQLTGGRELNHHPLWSSDGQEVYFFQIQPAVGFRRIPAVGGPSSEVLPWDWQVQNAPYFDPTGRFVAYTRQRPLGAPRTDPEHTVIHELATGRERVWPEPHTHLSGWSPDGASIIGWQHDGSGGNVHVITLCRVADGSCRSISRGRNPKWSVADNRIYFTRPARAAEQLWSIAIDGSDERRMSDLGVFSALAGFIDVSRDGILTWAPFQPGRQELWTATLVR
jgi:TolB protein